MDKKELNHKIDCYRKVFNTTAGEVILKELAKMCFENKSTFEKDDPNGRESAYNEGKRFMIGHIRMRTTQEFK